MGCDWIFRFTPCAPHHNHPDYFHLTMGAHLLCLESITHHDFQFGLEDFERFLPSMVQASPFYSTNSSKIWPTMNFFATISPPLWSNAPCPFVDKGHQTICHKFTVKSKILHSNDSRNPLEIRILVYYKDPISSIHKRTIEICHYVLHKKCHDNFLESSCDSLFRIIIFKLLTLSSLCQWSVFPRDIFTTLHLCMVEGGPVKGLRG